MEPLKHAGANLGRPNHPNAVDKISERPAVRADGAAGVEPLGHAGAELSRPNHPNAVDNGVKTPSAARP